MRRGVVVLAVTLLWTPVAFAQAAGSKAQPTADTGQRAADALYNQLSRCWHAQAVSEETGTVIFRLTLNPDGSLANSPDLLSAPNSKTGPKLAEAAKQVILKCQPFKGLNRERYQDWRIIEVALQPNVPKTNPVVSNTTPQRHPSVPSQARSSLLSPDRAVAALRHLHPDGSKLQIRRVKVAAQGFALIGWLDPVTDTGSDSLLKLSHGRWVLAGIDTDWTVDNLRKEGVPDRAAVALTSAVAASVESSAGHPASSEGLLKATFEKSGLEGTWSPNCATFPYYDYYWAGTKVELRSRFANGVKRSEIRDIRLFPNGTVSLTLKGEPNPVRPTGVVHQVLRIAALKKKVIQSVAERGTTLVKDGLVAWGSHVGTPALAELRCSPNIVASKTDQPNPPKEKFDPAAIARKLDQRGASKEIASDTMFTTHVLSETANVVRKQNCSQECEVKVSGAKFSVSEIKAASKLAGYLIVTDDTSFCGSAGCSSAVLAFKDGRLALVKEGLGITETEALHALSNNRAASATSSPARPKNPAGRTPSSLTEYSSVRFQVICSDTTQMLLAGGPVLTVIMDQNTVNPRWFVNPQKLKQVSDFVTAKAVAQCGGRRPESVLAGVGVRGTYGGIDGPLSAFGKRDGKWYVQKNAFPQILADEKEKAVASLYQPVIEVAGHKLGWWTNCQYGHPYSKISIGSADVLSLTAASLVQQIIEKVASPTVAHCSQQGFTATNPVWIEMFADGSSKPAVKVTMTTQGTVLSTENTIQAENDKQRLAAAAAAERDREKIDFSSIKQTGAAAGQLPADIANVFMKIRNDAACALVPPRIKHNVGTYGIQVPEFKEAEWYQKAGIVRLEGVSTISFGQEDVRQVLLVPEDGKLVRFRGDTPCIQTQDFDSASLNVTRAENVKGGTTAWNGMVIYLEIDGGKITPLFEKAARANGLVNVYWAPTKWRLLLRQDAFSGNWQLKAFDAYVNNAFTSNNVPQGLRMD